MGILDQLTAILREPTSNLTAAALLLAAMTLVVLIIIIGLLLVVTRPPARRRLRGRGPALSAEEYEYPELSAKVAPRLPGEPAPRRDRAQRLLGGRSGVWLIGALVVLAVVGGFLSTSTESYCLGACHSADPGMTDKSRAQHKSVSCVACHEDPEPVGALSQRGAHLAGQVVPGVRVYAGPVPSRRCLKCHAEIRSTVMKTAGGARMSHREPLDAGMACRDCHGQVGHRPDIAVTGMAECVRCHDSRTASADCRSCHSKDTGHASAAAQADSGFPRVQLGPVEDCGGCHDQVSCDKCHGVRMPHSKTFLRWQHARAGAWEGKRVCWRCHLQTDCTKCHNDFPGHAPGWEQEHKTAPKNSVCACHYPRLPAEMQTKRGFCIVCH